jgi:hypothetical protein
MKILGSLSYRRRSTTLRRPERVFKHSRPITFTAGVTVGGLGGFILGALFGKYALHMATVLFGALDRRHGSDEERLRFELLLQ